MIRRSFALLAAGVVFAAGAAFATMHQQKGRVEAQPAPVEHVMQSDRAYPGIGPVLDMADELHLSDFQRQQLRALATRVQNETNALQREIAALEQRLNRGFAEQTIDPLRIDGLTTRIGQLEGRLRAAELMARLDAKAILLPEQLARFGALSTGATGAALDLPFEEN
jgi:Spy/CpxP family protein refolding chaperone